MGRSIAYQDTAAINSDTANGKIRRVPCNSSPFGYTLRSTKCHRYQP